MARYRTPETASALHRKQKTPAFPQRNRKDVPMKFKYFRRRL
jgi:hypothetical protein